MDSKRNTRASFLSHLLERSFQMTKMTNQIKNLFRFSVFYILIGLVRSGELCAGQGISVITPCAGSHVKYLPQLLEDLSLQTQLPDEVVISVSDVDSDLQNEIQKIKCQKWPFELRIYTSPFKQYAGQNRNIAILQSSGDLIICQDADDHPHPQRIEIIHKTFNEFNCNLLLHYCYNYNSQEINIEDFRKSFNQYRYSYSNQDLNIEDTIRFVDRSDDFDRPYFISELKGPLPQTAVLMAREYRQRNLLGNHMLLGGLHFGNCAFNRKIFENVQYSAAVSGQDVKFCTRVSEFYDGIFLLHAPLILYMNNRTTWAERQIKPR
jgi:glycosyltransferase involved in cell wall biosynthesis